jgi:hypothetical protein
VKKELFASLRQSQLVCTIYASAVIEWGSENLDHCCQAYFYPKIEDVLAVDIMAIWAKLSKVIDDQYGELLALKDTSARTVLDILQTVRHCFHNALSLL